MKIEGYGFDNICCPTCKRIINDKFYFYDTLIIYKIQGAILCEECHYMAQKKFKQEKERVRKLHQIEIPNLPYKIKFPYYIYG